MKCCCQNILQLCRVSVCSSNAIKIGVNAEASGEYVLVLNYLGIDVVLKKSFETDEPLEFSSQLLNEDYKYQGKIYKPDGTELEMTVDEVIYNCVSFQTAISYILEGAEVVPPDVEVPCSCPTAGSIEIKVDGNEGSPVAATFLYQNDILIGAEVHDILVNKTPETVIDNDFTFDSVTGTITRTNIWFPFDTGIIKYIKIPS